MTRHPVAAGQDRAPPPEAGGAGWELHRRRGLLAPDPGMWEALGQGEGLLMILTDFYSRVYADDRLAPFFDGVTMDRAIEKQFLFLRSIFTGERVYFGNHPRNAHHWMVISDELFDYREDLMEGCLRRFGLADELVGRWRAVEEVFRRSIVKDRAWRRRIGGQEIAVDGYGTDVLCVGSLCDSCQAVLAPGSTVHYHLRTGKLLCVNCHGPETAA